MYLQKHRVILRSIGVAGRPSAVYPREYKAEALTSQIPCMLTANWFLSPVRQSVASNLHMERYSYVQVVHIHNSYFVHGNVRHDRYIGQCGDLAGLKPELWRSKRTGLLGVCHKRDRGEEHIHISHRGHAGSCMPLLDHDR